MPASAEKFWSVKQKSHEVHRKNHPPRVFISCHSIILPSLDLLSGPGFPFPRSQKPDHRDVLKQAENMLLSTSLSDFCSQGNMPSPVLIVSQWVRVCKLLNTHCSVWYSWESQEERKIPKKPDFPNQKPRAGRLMWVAQVCRMDLELSWYWETVTCLEFNKW